MTKYSTFYIVLFVLVNAFLIIVESYKIYSTENPEICSAIKKKKIKFPKDDGIIVRQTRLQYHSSPWEKNFLCKFQLDAAHDDGVFAVVQNIVLRKNETTNECIDYVQFKRHDSSTSKKYCGRIQAALSMDHHFALDPLADRFSPTGNSYIDPQGQINVEIFINREKLQPDEEMDLKIVFTPYRRCTQKAKYDKPCSEDYNNFCIYENFFEDGYVNCPFPDCTDEFGCSKEEEFRREKTYHNSIGNKVLIGSVSTLLLTFGIFIVCLWICKHYGKFCWSDDFVNPNVTEPSNPDISRTLEFEEISLSTRQTTAPTAPSCDNDPNKDLPPSYNSLFPAS